jgi:hypothetical protein
MMKRTIRYGLVAAAALAAGVANAQISLYLQPGFAGERLTLNDSHHNLDGSAFYDSVSSIVVQSGRWEACSQPNFTGDCQVFGPGRYPTLDRRMNHRIESVRALDKVAVIDEPRYAPEYRVAPDRYAVRPDYGRPSAELFAAPNFRGPSQGLDRNAWNLDRYNFADRASSVIIREGRWELCSDRGFEGDCRVFGPGEYRRLGPRLDERVSSVRRVG